MSNYRMHIPAPYVHPIYTDDKIDTPVGIEAPLPVQILTQRADGSFGHSNAQAPLVVNVVAPIRLRTNDTLLVATTNLFLTGAQDLLGSTSTELPTLDGCGQYRKLIWFCFRDANAGATNYTILARATDHNGAPLGTGWQTLTTGSFPELTGGATEWRRIDIPATGDGYYDQYRIVVERTSGNGYSLISKIVGVR